MGEIEEAAEPQEPIRDSATVWESGVWRHHRDQLALSGLGWNGIKLSDWLCADHALTLQEGREKLEKGEIVRSIPRRRVVTGVWRRGKGGGGVE
jgi:hypothetical protein